jgi:hypothetical protein
MKILSSINVGLILLTLLSCQQESRVPDKVKIKSMTVLKQFNSWLNDDNLVSDTLLLHYYIEYDSLGNVTYEKINDFDLKGNTFYYNNYNQNAALMSRYCSRTKNSKAHLLDTFIYDNKKRLIKQIVFGLFKDDINETLTYQYNDAGQLTTKFSKATHNGEYLLSYRYEADKLIEKTDGIYRIVYTYGPTGQLLKETEFYTMAWNDFGRPPLSRSSKDTVEVTRYRYDNRHKLKTRTTENRETFAQTSSRYDNNGLMIEERQGKRRLWFRYELY